MRKGGGPDSRITCSEIRLAKCYASAYTTGPFSAVNRKRRRDCGVAKRYRHRVFGTRHSAGSRSRRPSQNASSTVSLQPAVGAKTGCGNSEAWPIKARRWLTECSAAEVAQHRFGTMGSQVRILPLRPFFPKTLKCWCPLCGRGQLLRLAPRCRIHTPCPLAPGCSKFWRREGEQKSWASSHRRFRHRLGEPRLGTHHASSPAPNLVRWRRQRPVSPTTARSEASTTESAT